MFKRPTYAPPRQPTRPIPVLFKPPAKVSEEAKPVPKVKPLSVKPTAVWWPSCRAFLAASLGLANALTRTTVRAWEPNPAIQSHSRCALNATEFTIRAACTTRKRGVHWSKSGSRRQKKP